MDDTLSVEADRVAALGECRGFERVVGKRQPLDEAGADAVVSQSYWRLIHFCAYPSRGHVMKLRTVYLKVNDMERSSSFWQRLLGSEPVKRSGKWTEFMLGTNRLGLLLNDFGDEFKGSGSVPVFEFEEDALHEFVKRATENGATVVVDGLKVESMKSIVLCSPDGHEFELCMCHT
ncbi:VOC family protein [Burkholderia aenigmatica]|nr:VOC family protein [Burkholderia aenigmatica]UKD15554.1 VOC family protein [Burkholderia aenigmatica]